MSNRMCLVQSCDRERTRRDWCLMHYARWRTHGDPLINPRETVANDAQDTGTKTCTTCLVEQPVTNFHRVGKAGRRHTKCGPCRCAQRRAAYRAAPERSRERAIWGGVKYKYGITREQYDEMNARQGGLCAICGSEPTTRVRPNQTAGPRLAIDHDHHTGRVRGLLCITCNLAIGYFRDKPSLLMSAADYLRGCESDRGD